MRALRWLAELVLVCMGVLAVGWLLVELLLAAVGL